MGFAGNNALLGAAGGKLDHFKVTFLTGTTPTEIVLHSSYTGPADPSLAYYDPGNGVWYNYSSNTIPIAGDYLQIKGDWRNAAGGYEGMFYDAFIGTAYTCKFSGQLDKTPSNFENCYREIFRGCNAVKAIDDNPLPILTGAPAASMFYYACYGMTGVTGALPTGFMDTSGLTGAPAGYMFRYACYNMSGVEGALPTGFMDTSGLTGAPAGYMFDRACQNMTGVTGALPTGFMDTSGLTGAPAVAMFRSACQNMTGVTGALPTGFLDTSGLTGAPAGDMFYYACYNMSGVEGALPTGFMDTSGLTGAPAVSMFRYACYGMTGVTGGNITIGAGITLDSANIVGPFDHAFRGMTEWTGQIMWGAQVLVEAIPKPDSRIYTFLDSINMPNYATIDANWK